MCLLFLFLCLAGVIGPTGAAGADEAGGANSVTPLTIETATGAHDFQVEVAATRAERERGLMFRTGLAPNRGMLFDYGAPRGIAMWMKNTLIPLDMIFVDAGGRVVNVYVDAVPRSLSSIRAARPARVVIEVPGGTAARLGIAAGDRVRHEVFGDQFSIP